MNDAEERRVEVAGKVIDGVCTAIFQPLKWFRGLVRCPQLVYHVQAPDIDSAEKEIIREFLEDKSAAVVEEIEELEGENEPRT